VVIRRGEIWWASLPIPQGSRPGYRRPVLVVQGNEFNDSQIRTVVVVAVTSNLRLAAAPGNVVGRKRETGLPRDSVFNTSQVLTVDKTVLTERAGAISNKLLRGVAGGLRLVLDL
jgi:mRNA interferase MazF